MWSGWIWRRLLKDPDQKSDLTGRANVDLRMKSAAGNRTRFDRVKGTYAFEGPRVAAAGYDARDVQVTGSIRRSQDHTERPRGCIWRHRYRARFHRDAGARPRARVRSCAAARSTSTCESFQRPPARRSSRPNLSVADYHVTGAGRSINGTANLNQSTVEGATHRAGHHRGVRSDTDRQFRIRRAVPSPNLDLHRLGAALEDRRARQACLRQPDQRHRST